MDGEKHIKYMQEALAQAQAAAGRGEVPIGAVLVHRETGVIAAAAGNETIARHDPTAHAEIAAIRQVCAAAGSQRIPDYDLYVTLEPCAMCAAAISFARIGRVYYGADDAKGGGVAHGGKFYEQATCHHRPVVTGGVMADECGQILKDFFAARRLKP
jgi:tRNA(Arg) A34 adenosine deaminase TadA